MLAFLRKHPLGSYYTLALALSWGAVLAVVYPGDIPATPEDAKRHIVPVYLAMLLGPPVAGIVMTAITAGRRGLRDFVHRLVKWRVPLHWYAIALGTAPIIIGLVALLLAQRSSVFVPGIFTGGDANPAGPFSAQGVLGSLAMALAVGAGAGFFEELGWTGFAMPQARQRHDALGTGLRVGLWWGTWHFLAVYWGSADAFGAVPIPLFLLVALYSTLPPYRILMAWVYERTHSLCVAILMHASLTTSSLVLGPSLTGQNALLFSILQMLAFWVLALALRRWAS